MVIIEEIYGTRSYKSETQIKKQPSGRCIQGSINCAKKWLSASADEDTDYEKEYLGNITEKKGKFESRDQRV